MLYKKEKKKKKKGKNYVWAFLLTVEFTGNNPVFFLAASVFVWVFAVTQIYVVCIVAECVCVVADFCIKTLRANDPNIPGKVFTLEEFVEALLVGD